MLRFVSKVIVISEIRPFEGIKVRQKLLMVSHTLLQQGCYLLSERFLGKRSSIRNHLGSVSLPKRTIRMPSFNAAVFPIFNVTEPKFGPIGRWHFLYALQL